MKLKIGLFKTKRPQKRRKAVWDYLSKKVHSVTEWVSVVGTLVLVSVAALVVMHIILRNFGLLIKGTYELVEIMVGVMVSFTLAYAMAERAHIAVRVVLVRLPQRIQAILGSITLLLSTGVFALLAWASSSLAYTLGLEQEVSDTLGIPILPFRFILVSGFTLLCVVLGIEFIQSVPTVRRK